MPSPKPSPKMRRLLLTLALSLLTSPAFAAWTRVGGLGTATNLSAGVALVLTTSATLEAGNVAVCSIGVDEPGTGTTDGDAGQIAGVTDSAGNTWVEGFEWCNMQTSTLRDGVCAAGWYSLATTQLTSGDTITIAFLANFTAKAATCDEWTIGAGSTVALAAGANGTTQDAADVGNMQVVTGVVQEHLFIRANACESNHAGYTADTDYTIYAANATADTGTAATSMGARGESRIATESTSATSNPTWVVADCASVMFALDEVAAAACSSSIALLGVGCK